MEICLGLCRCMSDMGRIRYLFLPAHAVTLRYFLIPITTQIIKGESCSVTLRPRELVTIVHDISEA